MPVSAGIQLSVSHPIFLPVAGNVVIPPRSFVRLNRRGTAVAINVNSGPVTRAVGFSKAGANNRGGRAGAVLVEVFTVIMARSTYAPE